jgi:hypothetical protein
MSIIFSDPIGSSQDQPFLYQDLLNVDLEFPQSTATYFSGNQDVICINVPWQSGNQQCSTKVELWIPPVYKSIPVPPPHCVVGCEPGGLPPPVITPEPVYFGLVVGLIGVMLLVRRLVRAR